MTRLARCVIAINTMASFVGGLLVSAFLVETFSLWPLIANIICVIVRRLIALLGTDQVMFRAAVVVATLTIAVTASASEEALLSAKTAADFSKYVAAVEARRARDITDNEPFLDIERQPPAQLALTMAALRRGEVIVTRGAARDASSNEISIDGGLINHWRGTVFVPKVKLDAVSYTHLTLPTIYSV